MAKHMWWLAAASGSLFMTFSAAVSAQADAAQGTSPLQQGGYVSPMIQYLIPDGNLDQGVGGLLLGGYRNGHYAVEAGATYTDASGAVLAGAVLNGLLFPFASYPSVYGTIGLGALEIDSYPGLTLGEKFSTTTIDAGVGNLYRMVIGNYEYAIRAEARYRYGEREKRINNQMIDIDAPRRFRDVLLNVGLYLPLSKMAPPPPPPEPVKVVAPPPDSDGDGVPDDIDQCPGTPTGTPVDAKGCPLPPPPPPCKEPAPGERISLAGCATGDVVVLRGVNFEFDKAKLTVNAKTILDNVGDELKAYPSIRLEVGGHTDSKGSDEYNQRLSDARAASVVEYLASLGVAEDRMTAVGYGESQPVADNETDEGREFNRRVELKITTGNVDGVSVAPTPGSAEAVASEEASAKQAAAAPEAAAPAEAALEPATAVAPDTVPEAAPEAVPAEPAPAAGGDVAPLP